MMRTIVLAGLLALGTGTPALTQSDAPEGLRPGDVINLRIWMEPDLSGQFMVHEDGTAILPRLGPIVVVGKDAEAFKHELIEEYSKTLQNPSIEVILQRRVTITGHVTSPGLYPVDPTISLTDALALAGGATERADRSKVVLIRNGERTTYNAEEALSLEDISLRSGDQLYIPQKGWFTRNWPVATSVLATVMSVAAFALTKL